MRRKFNSYNIVVLPNGNGKYEITVEGKDEARTCVTFGFDTAIGLSEVQQLFWDLTDSQCEEMLKDAYETMSRS